MLVTCFLRHPKTVIPITKFPTIAPATIVDWRPCSLNKRHRASAVKSPALRARPCSYRIFAGRVAAPGRGYTCRILRRPTRYTEPTPRDSRCAGNASQRMPAGAYNRYRALYPPILRRRRPGPVGFVPREQGEVYCKPRDLKGARSRALIGETNRRNGSLERLAE